MKAEYHNEFSAVFYTNGEAQEAALNLHEMICEIRSSPFWVQAEPSPAHKLNLDLLRVDYRRLRRSRPTALAVDEAVDDVNNHSILSSFVSDPSDSRTGLAQAAEREMSLHGEASRDEALWASEMIKITPGFAGYGFSFQSQPR